MSEENRIKIILDIFSGRENPEWVLNDTETDILLGKVVDLPKINPVKPPILGYRGFVVNNIPKASELPEKIVIYNKTVIYSVDEKLNYYEDINELEEWLISQKAFNELETVIRDELKRNKETERNKK
jgi:hypothetical protein